MRCTCTAAAAQWIACSKLYYVTTSHRIDQCTTFGNIALCNATLKDVFLADLIRSRISSRAVVVKKLERFYCLCHWNFFVANTFKINSNSGRVAFQPGGLAFVSSAKKKQFNTTLWKRIQCVGIQWSAVKMFGAQKAASVFPEYSRHPSECSEDAIDSAAWWRWSS